MVVRKLYCSDQGHLGLCLVYIPALGSVIAQGTTQHASDKNIARVKFSNPL